MYSYTPNITKRVTSIKVHQALSAQYPITGISSSGGVTTIFKSTPFTTADQLKADDILLAHKFAELRVFSRDADTYTFIVECEQPNGTQMTPTANGIALDPITVNNNEASFAVIVQTDCTFDIQGYDNLPVTIEV